MEYIDVHCHIMSREFDNDREDVLKRALDNGVTTILVTGENFEDDLKILSFCSKKHENSPKLIPLLGHHPDYIDLLMAEKVEKLIRENKDIIYGIGEVGKDFWTAQNENEREIQEQIFIKWINLSNELDLPLNVHSRSAGHYTIETLIKYNAKKVCLHAFDGKAKYIKKAIDNGFYFSIPASIIRSKQKQNLVTFIPLEFLLLETDSPVLSPNREERNEPKNIVYAAQKVSEIKKVSIEKVAEITTNNAIKLFNLNKKR